MAYTQLLAHIAENVIITEMKISLLPIALIFLTSCNSKSEYFNGFGELKIGYNINSIESVKLFAKEKEGIYTIDRFKLSDKIGYVKNLQVKTDDDEIYDVSFTNDETTNSEYIDSILENLQEHNLIHAVPNPDSPIQILEFNDGKVVFAKILEKSRIEQDNVADYRYFNIKKAVN